MGPQQSVLVVGSIIIDSTVAEKRLPLPRETIHGHDAICLSVRRGGNQAMVVGAANSQAIMIGAVGDDAQGTQAISSLQKGRRQHSGDASSAVLWHPAVRSKP